MAPGDCFTWPVTPSLPLAPSPVGHFTAVPLLTCCDHSGLTAERYVVKAAVVPLLSARWITVIFEFGRFSPGLSFFSRGSCQLVILPKKIPASASEESCKGFCR